MSTFDTPGQKTSGTDPRPNYIVLGTDSRDAQHVYDTRTETVHIVHPDGSRGRRLLDAGTIDDYVQAVEDAIGWSTRRYAYSFADALDRAVTID